MAESIHAQTDKEEGSCQTIAHPIRPACLFDLAQALQAALEKDEMRAIDEGHTKEETEETVAPSAQERPPVTSELPVPDVIANLSNANTTSTSRPPISLKHQRRKRIRQERASASGMPVRPSTRQKLIKLSAPVVTPLKTESLPAASCGYIAKAQKADEETNLSPLGLESLLGAGYHLVEWDGRQPRPICDDQGRIFAALAGRPNSPSWEDDCRAFHQALVASSHSTAFTGEQLKHRRGQFPAVNLGVSHGKGTKRPINLAAEPPEAHDLLKAPQLHRMASFASHAFQLWAPKLFDYYVGRLTALFTHPKFTHLQRIFPRCVFPRIALNFGPRVWTNRHRDSMNCPFGWCSIQALGSFDHKKGGHLVLDDLRLVIEFPANSVVLIPSATLMHANLPVQDAEERSSVTLFCPGGLFRFVDGGFRTEAAVKKRSSTEYKKLVQQKSRRWEMGIGLYSTLNDFITT